MQFGLFFRGCLVNKSELVAAVADATGLSKAEATQGVDAVLQGITTALVRGDEVRFVGFGTFSVSERAETQGRHPQTGEPMTIKASRQAKFKAGKGLKDSLVPEEE